MTDQLVSVQTLDSSLMQLECLSGNLSELLAAFRRDHIDPATGKLNVDSFEEGVQVVQLLWNKVKETGSECYSTEIKIDFGDSIPARIFEFLLAAIGLKV